MQLAATNEYAEYLSRIERELATLYELAKKARSIGIDPAFEPESHLAKDLGEIVEGLVGPPGIAERIKELALKKVERHEMALIIAEDIIHAKFGHTDQEKAAEQAVKTSLAVMTGGITAAPIQGISKVIVKDNPDRTKYLAIYYAGPIRSAAGTEQALTLIVGDMIRRRLGLDRYKPTDDEVHRFVEEIRLYEREVSRFQYHISDEELEYGLRNLTVEVTGTETDPVEVSSYRNLPRIETNRVRAGALRIVNDGIVGRSHKVLRIVEDLGLEGWEWLKKVKEVKQAATDEVEFMYMEDVIAGRPIFAFPSRAGGFRLRYGRSRNTGLAALGIHPATMTVLDDFLASGTQVRVEGPGKGGVIVPVDTVEPPVVKLKNGSVLRVETVDEALKLRGDVAEVLFLGDMLVAFGEFLENNKKLLPSGYVEEWWVQDVKRALFREFGSVDLAAKALELPFSRLRDLLEKPLRVKPTAQEALTIARKLSVPLHPRFTYFWSNISFEELTPLKQAISRLEKRIDGGGSRVELSPGEKVKEILEKLAVPHEVEGKSLVLREDAAILSACLPTDADEARLTRQKTIVETLENFSGIRIRDKALTYIGARMGRPEKARKRAMSPPVHGLFPVGLTGGSHRDIVAAAKKGFVQVEVARRKCPECGEITHRQFCPNCGSRTAVDKICPLCGRTVDSDVCPVCKVPLVYFEKRQLNLGQAFKDACSVTGVVPQGSVKGVRGLTSAEKLPEPLEKGILRAKYDLSVYKDGTVRFDATNAPLTHFKPNEAGISLEKLRQLGYSHDTYGRLLVDVDQVCELKIQDIIIPASCADYLISCTRFIDDLLERAYRLPRFYRVERREDLLGHMIVGFAPHTSAGIVGRIIGFTGANVCYAHPFWQNIKRRDCDGDEDAVMLALDVLLNFSKAYLPAQIGGMMDAPLLLMSTLDPFEVDEARNMDVAASYPLAFYEKTLEHADPRLVSNMIDIIEHRLGNSAQYEGYCFTHETVSINEGNLSSSYMRLGAMSNKIAAQLHLAEVIRAVECRQVAEKVLTTHLMRDIIGNLSAFTKQKLRCKDCNAKYRRIPLTGKCSRCGGELLPTVYRKGIEKYLDVADELVNKYDLSLYYKQRIALVRDELSLMFSEAPAAEEAEAEKGKQMKLGEFL